jgi:hypothetical protein
MLKPKLLKLRRTPISKEKTLPKLLKKLPSKQNLMPKLLPKPLKLLLPLQKNPNLKLLMML